MRFNMRGQRMCEENGCLFSMAGEVQSYLTNNVWCYKLHTNQLYQWRSLVKDDCLPTKIKLNKVGKTEAKDQPNDLGKKWQPIRDITQPLPTFETLVQWIHTVSKQPHDARGHRSIALQPGVMSLAASNKSSTHLEMKAPWLSCSRPQGLGTTYVLENTVLLRPRHTETVLTAGNSWRLITSPYNFIYFPSQRLFQCN